MPKRLITLSCLLALFILGALIHKDYGIALDEPAQRLIGIANVNYVSQVFGIDGILKNPHFLNFTSQNLFQLEDRHYGVIFEFPAALLELFIENNTANIYQARHQLTFIYFVIGLYAIYKISITRFHSWRIALFTCLIVLLSPRIFADAFYNSKDIVFLSTYALASYSLIQFLLNPNWRTTFFHSLFSAIAIDTRLIGFIFPALTLLIFIIQPKKRGFTASKGLALLSSYLIFCIICMIAFWPYLWSNPLNHLLEAFDFISRHPHSPTIIFFGRIYDTSRLPWYYIPSWIAISTPPLYLGLFSIGLLSIVIGLRRIRWSAIFEGTCLIDLILLALLFGPIIAVSLSHAPLYNGWRHLYFIFPFIALIGVKGFLVLLNFAKDISLIKFLILFGLSVNFIYIGSWMIKNHPLQNLYFNFLAGSNWSTSFETDYWGLANKNALDKILTLDHHEKISIWPGSNSKFKSGEPTVFTDQLILKSPEIRQKILSPLDIENTKYVIASKNGNYSEGYLSNHGRFKKIDSIKIDGSSIISIFEQYKFTDLLSPEKNSKILFNKSGQGIFYLSENNNPPINWEQWRSSEWYSPEDWGSWAKGKSASLELKCPKERVDTLHLKMRAFTNNLNPSQFIQILVNDKFRNNFKFEYGSSKIVPIDITHDCIPNGRLTIKLRNLKPTSPQELGISTDNRGISIGLESAEFK